VIATARSPGSKRSFTASSFAALSFAVLGLGLGACDGAPTTVTRRNEAPKYVGREACVSCHQNEDRLWSASHHDLAMQEPSSATVLGDFDGTTFTYAGVTSTFSRRGDAFLVRTDGPDGELTDYEVAYVFGVTPLQQYLIEFPGGRLQALNVCWDTRPVSEGGQRWFHLYPGEEIDFEDPLHWTGSLQNWNFMCAECHSTNVKKNYREAEDRYETSWSEIDVSCEACHGPASEHVAWAKAAEQGTPYEADHLGLAVRLRDPGRDTWLINPETDLGMRLEPPVETAEMETCARCHSRRAVLGDDYVHGRPLADTHRLSWLDEGLYHADGQILDEVYVYGSYLQSKMHAAGVTCSDCHDAHGLNLRFPGNGVCARCHTAAKFDAESHHFHKPGTEGSGCVDCHMPPRNYMVVDPRHDHSMRVPRPDLSLALGTPNACNDCHDDKSVEWSVEKVSAWYGPGRRAEPHFGEALHAGRTGQADAEERLVALVSDLEAPAIVRASALSLLARYLGPRSFGAVEAALTDGDAQVRRAAVAALAGVDPAVIAPRLSPLLRDPARAVRIQAAQVLASAPGSALGAVDQGAMRGVLAEYEEVQLFNADRAENRLNLGWLHAQREDPAAAESEYGRALEMAPWLSAAWVNLADLYRNQGRDAEGEALLRRGIPEAADPADLHHALGLLLVRGQRLTAALDELERAADLRPDRSRYAYVYGVALNSAGRADEALAVLDAAHAASPADREILVALVTMNRDAGANDKALIYARRLLELAPDDVSVRQFVEQIEASTS
jgi:tetratricopeptide (TPR) repeat protein